MSNRLWRFPLLIVLLLAVFSSCEKVEDTTGTLIVNFNKAIDVTDDVEIKILLYPYEYEYDSLGPIDARVVNPFATSASFELNPGNYIVHHSVFGVARGVQVRSGECTVLNY